MCLYTRIIHQMDFFRFDLRENLLASVFFLYIATESVCDSYNQ
ncbi:hypothetical protein PULV_b0199 [Pseudoalteromonas ulvae UL12]|nr:hypothetical protein [Pseudoalteromonas ulvae UL12]